MMSSSKTDGQLLRQYVNQQDDSAFTDLVRRHQTMVFNVCMRRLQDTHLAEDAAQAVFLTLSRKASRLTGHPSLAGWLHHVALYVARNAQRSQQRKVMHESIAANNADSTTEPDEWEDTREILDEQIETLPTRLRQAMILFYFEQLSIAQIAQRLSTSEGTVSSWLSRGRNKLRQRLARHGIAYSGVSIAAILSNECCDASPSKAFASNVVQTINVCSSGDNPLDVTSPQVLELSQGAIQMMQTTNTKSMIATIAGVMLTAGAVTAAFQPGNVFENSLAQNTQQSTTQTGQSKDNTIITTDLLTLIQTDRDAIAGTWTKTVDGLKVSASKTAQLVIRTEPTGSYELNIDFTRSEGNDGVEIVLPVGGKQCNLELSGWSGAAHAITRVDGKPSRDSQNPTSVQPGKLDNNKKHTVAVKVTPGGENVSIVVTLNKKQIINWTGKKTRLQPHVMMQMPNNKVLGLAAFDSAVTFHKLELKSNSSPKTANLPNTTSKSSKTVSFEKRTWNISRADKVTVENFKGKQALHVVGQEAAYVWIPGTNFKDGTIEVDIASSTFSGIGFRGNSGGTKVQKLYFRPFNSGTAKNDRTVQYDMLGNKEAHWSELRKNFPGKYESGANIAVDKWFHVKLVIQGEKLSAYVNDQKEPVLVVEKMFDSKTTGTIGVWGWDSYFANFKFTPAR